MRGGTKEAAADPESRHHECNEQSQLELSVEGQPRNGEFKVYLVADEEGQDAPVAGSRGTQRRVTVSASAPSRRQAEPAHQYFMSSSTGSLLRWLAAERDLKERYPPETMAANLRAFRKARHRPRRYYARKRTLTRRDA